MKKALFLFLIYISIISSNAFSQQRHKPDKLEINNTDTAYAVDPFRLPWGYLMERDIAWKQRVWCDYGIGATTKDPGLASPDVLTSLLLTAANDGRLQAYSNADDRFTEELTKPQVNALYQKYKDGQMPVTKFRIKADWVLVGFCNMMTCRIVGIAPITETPAADGAVRDEVMFWVYFPDARDMFSKVKIANTDESWDHYLLALQNR